MYTLAQLLEDVVRQRGALTKKGGDYSQVWDVFNRYVTVVMEKQQTLSVLNFCKIGWRLEEGLAQGRAKLRPHFQVADSFARAYNVDLKAHLAVPDKYLAAVEEFNFSKAAIRFSQNLTKDHVFMGMRAIVQQIGEVVASGQHVSIDFEIGKLLCNERQLSFAFVADLYLREGLEVPSNVVENTDYRPSVSFAPPSKDALSLSLSGTNDFTGTIKATNLGGWEDTGRTVTTIRDAEPAYQYAESGGMDLMGSSGGVQSNLSRHEQVQQQALGRHLAQITEEAEEAMEAKEKWEEHLQNCIDEEQKDAEWRRALVKDYQSQLHHQMRYTEERKIQGRQHQIEQASMHDFPNFAESPELAVYDYIRERRNNLKQDLDQQVDIKKRLKLSAKQRERDLEAVHLQANHNEMARLKSEASGKKERERSALAQAWDSDKRLHTVKKAIEDHHKAPATKSDFSDIMASLGPNQNLMSSPRADGLSTPSSRPITGSVRRMPIGAAASLALNRDKLTGASPRR